VTAVNAAPATVLVNGTADQFVPPRAALSLELLVGADREALQ